MLSIFIYIIVWIINVEFITQSDSYKIEQYQHT